MHEQLEKLQKTYDMIVENQIGRFEPGLSAVEFTQKYREAVCVQDRLRSETDRLVRTYLNPLLEESTMLTARDEESLYETAQKLSSYKHKTDPALALKIYQKLLSLARSEKNDAKTVKYLYWCGITSFYLIHHTTEHKFDKMIAAYFEEGSEYYKKYDAFNDPETRQYINRCLGNKSMMHYRLYSHEEAVASEEAAFSFWNSLMFQGKDIDFPWLSYFISCYTHRHNNIFRKMSKIMRHEGIIKKEQANELLGIAITLSKLYHANHALYDTFGGSRYEFLLWRAQFFAGLISFGHLYENTSKLAAKFEDNDYSSDALYVKSNVWEHLIAYASQLKILKDVKDSYIPGALNNLLNYLSSIPVSVNPAIISDLLRDFVQFVGPLLELSEQIDLVYKLTSRRHIQSYAHAVMTGKLSSLLTRSLIGKDPGQFTGCLGIKSAHDVISKSDELCQFANKAGMCHDIGMIIYAANPFMTARVLTYEELELVKDHPEIGAKFLLRDNETLLSKGYHDIVLGHHKHYDNKGGYPESFDMDSSDVKVLINIVSVANVLDSLTDNISLQPEDALSAQEAISIILSGAGSEFSPVIAELLEDNTVTSEIENILNSERQDVYYTAYKNTLENQTMQNERCDKR